MLRFCNGAVFFLSFFVGKLNDPVSIPLNHPCGGNAMDLTSAHQDFDAKITITLFFGQLANTTLPESLCIVEIRR